MSKTLLALVLAALLCPAALAADAVTVGTNAEFPPFEFTDDNNVIVGFDIDVITAVGKAGGFAVEMQHMSFDTLIAALEADKIDAVASGMTITDVRREKVDFSDPYYNAAQVIVVREDSPAAATMDSIKDKLVGVQLGTTGATMAEEAMGEANENLKQFRKYNEVFTDLSLGRIDAVVVDLPVAQAYLRRIPKLKITSEPMSEEQYGFAVKKGNRALLDQINKGLAAIRASGEYENIADKWFQD